MKPRQEPYTASSYTSVPPVFEAPEDREYRIGSSSSPSAHSDCPTPSPEPVFYQPDTTIKPSLIPTRTEEPLISCDELELEGGYGVDGEYDDYYEFLRPAAGMGVDEKLGDPNVKMSMVIERDAERKREGRRRETWAFQLDCENERILEV